MPTYVFFWRINEPNGIYSQWYPSPFTDSGVTFSCAEQYMMYHKALTFNDHEIAAQILRCNVPVRLKALGRKVRNFNEEKWTEVRLDIVKRANVLKFSQNPKLLQKLLSHSPSCIFVEASPRDKIWGIGFAKDKALSNKNKWGLNLLGVALSYVRNLYP